MTQKAGSKKARNRAARLSAVQAVYQLINSDKDSDSIVREYVAHRLGLPVDGEAMVTPDKALFSRIVSGVGERMDDLEGIVQGSYKRAKSGRAEQEEAPEDTLEETPEADESQDVGKASALESLLQAILLCGSFELMAHHDIDAPIIISDYLEVTHSFYEKGEAGLVNAVLDQVARSVRD